MLKSHTSLDEKRNPVFHTIIMKNEVEHACTRLDSLLQMFTGAGLPPDFEKKLYGGFKEPETHSIKVKVRIEEDYNTKKPSLRAHFTMLDKEQKIRGSFLWGFLQRS